MEIQFQQQKVKVRKITKTKAAAAAAGRSSKKFIGVRQRPSGRWVAEIKDTTQKIRMWLGTFESAEEAARAYDEAACLLRGANTRTNFLTSAAQLPSDSPLASRITNLLNNRKRNNNIISNENNNNNSAAAVVVEEGDGDADADADADADDRANKRRKQDVEEERSDADAYNDDGEEEDDDVYRPDMGGFSFLESSMLELPDCNMEEQQQLFQFQFERQISASLYAINGLHQYMKETTHVVYDPADAALWDLPPLCPLLT